MKNLLVTAVSSLLLATVADPAHATSFIGDQMKASWRLPTETSLFAFNMSPSSTFKVGQGVEGIGSLTNVAFNIDFGRDTLTFTFLTAALFSSNTFNGIYFQQLGDGEFGEVLSMSGIARSRLHNMGNAFSVNFSGQRYAAGDKVTINFASGVPEPATWAMMILGFGLAGATVRRRPFALKAVSM